MISITNLCKSFGGGKGGVGRHEVLRGLSVEVRAGSAMIITGENGAGKTTLHRILLGLLPPTSGTVEIEGRQLATLSPAARLHLRRMVGVVDESREFLGATDAFGNVAFRPRLLGWAPPQVNAATAEALTEVQLPERAWHLPVAQLSAGEKALLALARAVVTGPHFLLIDEPTAHLDTRARARVAAVLQRLHAEGRTMLINTHDDALPPMLSGFEMRHLSGGVLTKSAA